MSQERCPDCKQMQPVEKGQENRFAIHCVPGFREHCIGSRQRVPFSKGKPRTRTVRRYR